MKASLKHDSKASYLDVTEFILKECSPLIKPTSPKPNFHEQVNHDFLHILSFSSIFLYYSL